LAGGVGEQAAAALQRGCSSLHGVAIQNRGGLA